MPDPPGRRTGRGAQPRFRMRTFGVKPRPGPAPPVAHGPRSHGATDRPGAQKAHTRSRHLVVGDRVPTAGPGQVVRASWPGRGLPPGWTCPGRGTRSEREGDSAKRVSVGGLAAVARGGGVRHSAPFRTPSMKWRTRPARGGTPVPRREEEANGTRSPPFTSAPPGCAGPNGAPYAAGG